MGFNLLSGVLLFASLIVFVPARIDGDELFTLGALMVLTVSASFLESKRKVNMAWPAAIFAYALVMVPLSGCVAGWGSVLSLFAATLAVKALAEKSAITIQPVVTALMAFMVLTYVWIGLQAFGIERWYSPAFDGEMAGVSFRPWILGCTAALAIPVVMVKSWKLGLYFLPLLFVSKSSVCIAAGLTAAAMMIGRRHPTLLNGFIVLAVPAALGHLYFDGIESHRLQVWMNSLKHWDAPFLGEGLGSWAHQGFRHMNGADPYHWRWAHNEFYQHLFEQGFLGFLILLGALLWLWRQADVMRPALVSLFILCLFHPVLHWGKLSFFVVLIIAYAIAEGAHYGRRVRA